MYRKFTSALLISFLGGALGAAATPAAATVADRDCPNFATQPQAQRFFEQAGPGDPHRLDADDDNIACEDLPGAPAGAGGDSGIDDDAPAGGVAAGSGGTAGPASFPLVPAAAAGLGVLMATTGVVIRRRRSATRA